MSLPQVPAGAGERAWEGEESVCQGGLCGDGW